MSKMYAPAQDCHCFVTVEYPYKGSIIKHWKGRNMKAIREAAKKAYPDAKSLQFGNCFYVTR